MVLSGDSTYDSSTTQNLREHIRTHPAEIQAIFDLMYTDLSAKSARHFAKQLTDAQLSLVVGAGLGTIALIKKNKMRSERMTKEDAIRQLTANMAGQIRLAFEVGYLRGRAESLESFLDIISRDQAKQMKGSIENDEADLAAAAKTQNVDLDRSTDEVGP